jgi:DnaJ-class molecular chaperone
MKLYDILGVEKDASMDAIKKAWRRVAKKFHPDKKNGDKKKFQQAQEAYNVLKDQESRDHYDATGDVKKDVDSSESMLLEIFAAFIEHGDLDGDIIDSIRSKIKEHIATVNAQIIIVKKEIKKLNSLLGRVTSQQQENLFDMVLRAKLEAQESKVDAKTKQQAQLNELLNLLDGFFDTQPGVAQYSGPLGPGFGPGFITGL